MEDVQDKYRVIDNDFYSYNHLDDNVKSNKEIKEEVQQNEFKNIYNVIEENRKKIWVRQPKPVKNKAKSKQNKSYSTNRN